MNGIWIDGNFVLESTVEKILVESSKQDSELKQLRTENTAQAQEIERLKIYRANDGASACIKDIGFVHGTIETIDALQEHLYRQAQEILELKAKTHSQRHEIERLGCKLAMHGREPTQSLQAHNAAIEDDVIEACADVCADMSNTDGDKAEQAIRNMPRKYKEQDK